MPRRVRNQKPKVDPIREESLKQKGSAMQEIITNRPSLKPVETACNTAICYPDTPIHIEPVVEVECETDYTESGVDEIPSDVDNDSDEEMFDYGDKEKLNFTHPLQVSSILEDENPPLRETLDLSALIAELPPREDSPPPVPLFREKYKWLCGRKILE